MNTETASTGEICSAHARLLGKFGEALEASR